MPQTTSTNVSPSMGTVIYFERQVLKHAGPVVILDRFGLTKQMPKNKGVTIEFRRPNTFTAATTPLVEGITPASTAFT
jgi:N4-gp56 family major capsid protein